MKNVLMFFAVSVFAVQSFATENVEVDKIVKVNKVVAEILNEIVAQDDFADSLSIVLDGEKTDITKPKIGVSVEASTRQASWSSETTSLVATLEVDSKPVNESGQVELAGFISVELETDMYNFSKFIADQELCYSLYLTDSKESAACLTLQEELKTATNFGEQMKSVAKAVAAFKIELQDAIDSLEAEEDKDDLINYDIEELKSALKAMDAIVFADNGNGFSVTFDYDDNEVGYSLDFDIEFDEDSALIRVNFVVLVDQESLEGYVSFPAQIIEILAADTPESRKKVSYFARFYLDFLKGIVTED